MTYAQVWHFITEGVYISVDFVDDATQTIIVKETSPPAVTIDEIKANLTDNCISHWKIQGYKCTARLTENHEQFSHQLNTTHINGKQGIYQFVINGNRFRFF